MTPNDFPHIDHAVATDTWTAEALAELDNLVNDIENGRRIYKRFHARGARPLAKGNRRATKASIVLRNSPGAGGETQRLTALQRRLRDEAVSLAQERTIEHWARAEGIWFDNVELHLSRLQILANHSSEAIVYFNGGYTLAKMVSLSHFLNPMFAIDRIILHNMFFPDTAITVVGFGRTQYGEFQIVVNQPFIVGIKPEFDDIKTVIERYGFQQYKLTTYRNDHYLISDLHQGNVLHVTDFQERPLYMSDGTPLLAFIDTDMRFNTPDQGKDGKYVVDNGIVEV